MTRNPAAGQHSSSTRRQAPRLELLADGLEVLVLHLLCARLRLGLRLALHDAFIVIVLQIELQVALVRLVAPLLHALHNALVHPQLVCFIAARAVRRTQSVSLRASPATHSCERVTE